MYSTITALVTIRFQWVRIAGLERLLMPLADNRNASLTGTLVLPVCRYDTSDSAFVEVVFSSSAMEVEGTLCVPKTEIIAIVKTTDPEQMHKVGYRGRPKVEEIEPECVVLDESTPTEVAN